MHKLRHLTSLNNGVKLLGLGFCGISLYERYISCVVDNMCRRMEDRKIENWKKVRKFKFYSIFLKILMYSSLKRKINDYGTDRKR